MPNIYTLRDYQQQAVDAALETMLSKRPQKPGVIVMPTGSGKSLLISSIAQAVNEPILVFQPTREILEQNYNKMMDYGIMGVTIYSASMRKKDIGNVTLATIGSTFKKADLFKHFKAVLIDEAHLVNSRGGMYKSFLEEVGDRLVGLSATPWRLSHDGFGGSITKFITRTNPRVFSRVLHVTQTQYLSDMGYFSKTEYFPIKGFERGSIELNSTGADYLDTSERAYYDKISFQKQIIEIVNRVRAKGKKRILVFTKFVEEAVQLAEALGDKAAYVDGTTHPKIRAEIVRKFRSGEIEVVCNVGVFTTGFDYPELEVVIMARPTRSLGLWAQACGRAVRPHPLKESAWIIDLCGNFQAFGRLEDLNIVEQRPNIWQVVSKGRPLTNVYLDQINNL